MKIVHFADLHLDAQFAWAGAALGGRWRQAIRDALVRIVDLAIQERADAIFCAGDLYEQERFSADTAEFIRGAFERAAPIPVYIAPGNHDWYGPSSLYRQVDWSSNVTLFTADRLEPVTLLDGLTLWGAAHRAPANTDGFLDGFHVDRGGVHVALFHGSEQRLLAFQESGKAPHAPFRREQIAAAGLAHAFLGHFHAPADESTYTYPGNPEPLTFGEEGVRGPVVASIGPEGGIQRERYRIAANAVADVDVDVTGCASKQDVRQRVRDALAATNGIVRVTLSGEIDPSVELGADDVGDVAPHLAALVPRIGRMYPAYDVDLLAAEPTVRGQFVRDVRESDLDAAERRRVLTVGLRALAGRTDLEVA